MSERAKACVYLSQILFVGGMFYGFQSLQMEDFNIWGAVVARYIVYLMLIKASQEAGFLCCSILTTKQYPDCSKIIKKSQVYLMILGASIAVIVYLQQTILQRDFLLLFIGYLVTKYPEISNAPSTINYGKGMACSFFEGYLQHVIPSDGADVVGFEANATNFEDKHGVVIPVKRLFIVITKSLYSPPDLKEFNKPNSKAKASLPYLEARKSLPNVTKNVAGVINRTYRNSVYKICRPDAPPVTLVAECATPLHTLHGVIHNRVLYEHLSNLDIQEVVYDFCSTLQQIVDKSPACKGKCELVYFDDTDPDLNLADVLLHKLRQLEPDFENITRS